MTLVRISTSTTVQAVCAALGMAFCLVVLAVTGLPESLAWRLVIAVAVAGAAGATLVARRFREMDHPRPAPAGSVWTSGRGRVLLRLGACSLYLAAMVSIQSLSHEPSPTTIAGFLLPVLTWIVAQAAVETILATHVERRDDVVLLELRGRWGRETPLLYSVPARHQVERMRHPA